MRLMLMKSLCLFFVVGFASVGFAEEEAKVDYNTQIAPLFTKYCAGCHNDEDHDGDFSLESYDSLMKGAPAGPAVLAGDAKSSLMLRLIASSGDRQMPPEGEAKPTSTEVALLKQWIELGAQGPAGQEPDRLSILVPTIDSKTKLSPISAIDWSTDAFAVARFGEVAVSRKLRTIDPATRKRNSDWQQVQKIAEFPGKVTSVHFTHGGGKLITASGVTGLGGIATLWEWPLGRRVRDFKGHRDIMLDAEVSPDGKTLATSSYDKSIILWDIVSGEQLHTLKEHNGAVYDICFSPDGTLLASASADDTCKIWRVSDGERLDTMGQPLKEQYSIAFSPDGKFVAAGGADNRIRVWRLRSTGQPKINPLVHARFAHEGPILKLGYTADGTKLVSVAEDQTIKVWETRGYTEIALLKDEVDVSMALAIEPSGKQFALGRMDGSLDYRGLNMKAKPRKSNAGDSQVTAIAVSMDDMATITEAEPNTDVKQAQPIKAPATITGTVHAESGIDQDCFKFSAKQGEAWVVEVNAARSKSPLDSYVEVLHEDGSPIERMQLQAVRDSYFTFRGKDANQSNDFRVFNWEEMELNDYLFANGEVVKLWIYPRGPDSGFNVYPGTGTRWTFFDTTPLAHALGEPCYIVRPYPPEAELIPNGLPVFKLYYNNDDQSMRQLGKDSKVHFTAPADGNYIVRLRDVRNYQGADFKYTLQVRPRQPDFSVSLADKKLKVFKGSSKEIRFMVNRMDDYQGPVSVDVSGLPEGFSATSPIVFEEGQREAMGVITASADAKTVEGEELKKIAFQATATIGDKEVAHAVAGMQELIVEEKPKVIVSIVPAERGVQPIVNEAGKPPEFVIHPGETIMLKVKVERNGYDGEVSFGKEDSGRNTAHGVYVDNIGLNGLLLLSKQTEREFFITAAPIAAEQSRLFHLRTGSAGGHASQPIMLHVRKQDSQVAETP